MVDLDIHYRNHLLTLISDNHSLIISYSLQCKNERFLPLVEVLHHSVNFYFTVLSEPSQDSSLGQFLFYRPVRTVTGLITDEAELSVLMYIIYLILMFYNYFLKIFIYWLLYSYSTDIWFNSE